VHCFVTVAFALMCTQEYHEARGITPKEFAEKYAKLGDVKRYVSIVNDPRNP